MDVSPPDGKAVLRRSLRAARRSHAATSGVMAAEVLAQTVPGLLSRCELVPPMVVGAYYPLADEIDPRPLLAALRRHGYRTALPVTRGRDTGLLFRVCDEETALARSDFGVMEPVTGEEVTPDALLVPVLGFDASCHRLGYGAGHYDRTLAALRDIRAVFAVGLAFDMQRCAQGLPVEAHDQPLDCIVTDQGIYWPEEQN